MKILFLIGLGGFAGAILRYLVSGWAQTFSRSIDFPYGTLVVNLIGCFLIGALSQLAETRGMFTPEARALVFMGLLGGFTTFSSFANETMNLSRDGSFVQALLNIAASVLLGLGCVWLGRALVAQIWR